MKKLRFSDLEEGMVLVQEHSRGKTSRVYYYDPKYRRLLLRVDRFTNIPMTDTEFNEAGYVRADIQ